MDQDRKEEFREAAKRLLAASEEAHALSEKALDDLRASRADMLKRMQEVEEQHEADRVSVTRAGSYRVAVEAEKPLFDTTRYILQTVAVGLATATVGKGLVDDPSQSLVVLVPSCLGVAIGAILFFWMTFRVGWLAAKAADFWLTSLGVSDKWITVRAVLVVIFLLSSVTFTAQLAKFTLLGWLATH